MKTVYAIICEHRDAAPFYETVEMVCETGQIAQAWYDSGDLRGTPVRIEEMALVDGYPGKKEYKK